MDDNNNIEFKDLSDNFSDKSDILSVISDPKEINEIFQVRIRTNSNESLDSSDNESISDESYDTFNTSDSEIFKKQEIKMEILEKTNLCKKPTSYDLRNDVDVIFVKMLHELKEDKKIKKKKIVNDLDILDSSDDDYLHDYRFF